MWRNFQCYDIILIISLELLLWFITFCLNYAINILFTKIYKWQKRLHKQNMNVRLLFASLLFFSFTKKPRHVSFCLTDCGFNTKQQFGRPYGKQSMGTVVWQCFIVHRCLTGAGKTIKKRNFESIKMFTFLDWHRHEILRNYYLIIQMFIYFLKHSHFLGGCIIMHR